MPMTQCALRPAAKPSMIMTREHIGLVVARGLLFICLADAVLTRPYYTDKRTRGDSFGLMHIVLWTVALLFRRARFTVSCIRNCTYSSANVSCCVIITLGITARFLSF